MATGKLYVYELQPGLNYFIQTTSYATNIQYLV